MTPPREDELPLILAWRIRASSVYLLALGAVVLLGGSGRFASPALLVPRALMPFWGWGVTFFALGVLSSWAMFRSVRVLRLTLFAVAVPMMLLAIALLLSAGHTSTVSLMGAPTYLYIALSHILSGLGLSFGTVPSARLRAVK